MGVDTLQSWCLWILHYALYIPQFTDEHKYFHSNPGKLFKKAHLKWGKKEEDAGLKKIKKKAIYSR